MDRLDQAIADARRASGSVASALVTPVANAAAAGRLADVHCVFDHRALLMFPRSLAEGMRYFEDRGLRPTPPIPSTVVRRRLSVRYWMEPRDCDVHITRLHLDLATARRPAVEVFLLPRDSAAFSRGLEDFEVTHGFEDHVAFVVPRPEPPVIEELITTWRREAGLLWEGGGHNPHEGGGAGSTVMYFVRAHADPDRSRRFELHCAGDLSSFTTSINVDTEAVRDAYANWRRDS